MDQGSHTVNIATYAAWQPEWLNHEPLQGIADSAGLPVDKINYVLCLLAVYPLSFLYSFIPTSLPTLRHVVGMLVGFAFGLFCFRSHLIHVFVSSLGTYAIIRSDTKGAYSHWASMVFCMTYLMLGHGYRQYWYYGSYSLDYTGPQVSFIYLFIAPPPPPLFPRIMMRTKKEEERKEEEEEEEGRGRKQEK